MTSNNQKKESYTTFGTKQHGAALILLAFIIGLAVTALMIKSFNAASLESERDEDTMRALGQAKEALIAWSSSHPNWPGVMPFPDRGNESSGDGYDGKSDCVPSGLDYDHLIGKLALLGESNCISPQHGVGQTFRDSSGEVLWYAVSKNLIRTSGSAATPIINPSIINSTSDWLRVFDANGRLLSDKVAVVIIAPGPALPGQSRSITATPSNYLDEITIGANTYFNWRLNSTDLDFVAGGDEALSSTFNDRLIFITIDELMNAVIKRAAAEARATLITYHTANGRFPDASPIAAPLGANNYVAVSGNDNGTIPVDITDTVNCNYNLFLNNATCSVSFGLVDSVSLKRSGLSTQWNNGIDSCFITTTSNINDTCRCTDMGSCSAGSSNFTCAADGTCNMNVPLFSSGEYVYAPPSYATFPGNAIAGNCIVSGVNVECDGDGSFGIRGLNMPIWFTANNWQDYFYYHKRFATDLQVGDRTNVQALLIGSGKTLASTIVKPSPAQTRPSNIINDYLDSEENTNGDLIFDATTSRHSTTYNDQSFIVAP